MSKLAFDAKNSEDFESVTSAICSALIKIEKDSKIAPTQASLAKLAKIHRNTIRNRAKDNAGLEGGEGWPLSELLRIRRMRAEQSKNSAAEMKAGRDLSQNLEHQLEAARSKAAYWFHRMLDMKRDLHDSLIVNERLEARNKKLVAENNSLKLLRVVK
jgi:hypothetical protein